jgi:hypothetical protein
MNDKLKHTIIKHLNKEYSGLVRYETDIYPDYIFFMKDGKIIIEYKKRNGWVYISYNKIWSLLRLYFSLEYEEVKYLTKEWVEEQSKMEVSSILAGASEIQKEVEGQYKLQQQYNS